MGYCPLMVWICITCVWLKNPVPSSWSERHLQFASIRLCLALLFIITIQNLSNCNESSQFYEYFGSKFLAGFSNFEPLCGVVAATLSTLSSRLLAFKGCCACDTLVGLQAFRINEEPCRQQFLLLFSAFLDRTKWQKLAKNYNKKVVKLSCHTNACSSLTSLDLNKEDEL